MLEQVADHVGTPGKYEGEPPIVVFIDTNDYYDETSGDVEAPTGWFGRAGKWLIRHDDQGFVYSSKKKTEAEARDEFASFDAEYGEWLGDEDDDDKPEEVNPYAGPGGLLDEFKQAERLLGTE